MLTLTHIHIILAVAHIHSYHIPIYAHPLTYKTPHLLTYTLTLCPFHIANILNTHFHKPTCLQFTPTELVLTISITHTHTLRYIHTPQITHAHSLIYIPKHSHIYTLKCMQAHTFTLSRIHTHKFKHTYIHTHTHTVTNSDSHSFRLKHTFIHSHTRTPSHILKLGQSHTCTCLHGQLLTHYHTKISHSDATIYTFLLTHKHNHTNTTQSLTLTYPHLHTHSYILMYIYSFAQNYRMLMYPIHSSPLTHTLTFTHSHILS